MNGHDGSPTRRVTSRAAELLRDAMALGELQFELFKSDCRESGRRLLVATVLLLAGGAIVLSTLPVGLIWVASLLNDTAGLSPPLAYLLATVLGLILGGACALAGVSFLRHAAGSFRRTREELSSNLSLFRRAVARSSK
jgi:hypothetical protein